LRHSDAEGERPPLSFDAGGLMNLAIALWLSQDAVTNGAVYALLALALVVVYTVTRVILVPQGEFVSYAALSLATLQAGKVPGTVYLLIAVGVVIAALDGVAPIRRNALSALSTTLFWNVVVPLVVAAAAWWSASRPHDLALQVLVTLAIVTPMGPMLYRLAFQPLANASILVLLIIAVAVHYMMTGLGLVFFGGEGLRSHMFPDLAFQIGIFSISGQSIAVVATSLILVIVLAVLFGTTIYGKALRATAINRVGARLVGISTEFSGRLSFALAALIGAVSGILISPITTIYYDTGFFISLKGFIGAIIGGMTSYPLAAIGSLLVGFLESFSSFWASAFKESIVFTLIIPVLLWRSLATRRIEEDEEP
jgi:branched-subunit amino acid ABC-type transport system permease component